MGSPPRIWDTIWDTTWDTIWDKAGVDLQTVPDQNTFWTPSACADWKAVDLSLNAYINQSVLIRFVGVTGWGNNIYLDDIIIQEGMTSIVEEDPSFSIFQLFLGRFNAF